MKQTRILTKHRVAMAWVLGMSSLVTVEGASAQLSAELRWGRPIAPRAGACFYRDFNYRGDYFCAAPGENIAFLRNGMNDQISSIRTFGDTEVILFQDPRFRGRWARLDGDVRNLRREGWNDRLSSIRIESGWGRDRGDYARRNSGIGRIETGEWREGYWRDNRGEWRDRREGSGIGRADQRDPRYDPRDPRYDSRDRRDNNDSRDRRDDTNTGRRNSENVDTVIRRLYQEILQREPDAQGLALYRGRMLNENWSEQDVRDALVKSPEYRQRGSGNAQQNAEQIVARAYRTILGREPDPASRVYVDKILRERWSQADVERALRESPEYRNRNPF